MKILTRDDTDHNTEYVTRAEAESEIDVWKERALTKLTFEILSCMWCGELVEAPPRFELGSALTPEGRKVAFQGHTLKCAMHPIRPLIDASRQLVNARGRHHTQIAFERLRTVLDSQNV